ncbi:MAG: SH3 domain-containing protein [Cyanobacteria bacterium P01_F01_bin.42]
MQTVRADSWDMKKKISFPQLAIGMILGFLIVIGVIVGVSYFYFLQLSKTPPKPEYPEIADSESNVTSLASVSDDPASTQDSSYVALVVFEDGLIMRREPSRDSEVVLTLNFEETVRILGRSPDEKWEKVLLETTGDRGWVSRGNTKRVN